MSVWREGLFDCVESLIEIEICGNVIAVPENNNVLRCIQYARPEALSNGNYCWNGDCNNCQIWYRSGREKTRSGLACRLPARAGLIVTRLSADLTQDLRS